MRKVKAKKLTLKDYAQYGQFADLLHPEGFTLGEKPVLFYRDMLTVYSGDMVNGYSVVYCDKRKMVVDEAEIHNAGTEVLIPLDDDVTVFVAPAGSNEFPVGQEKAFIVPKGTMITFKPGVWHKAQYPINNEHVSVVCILPEREYARDCLVVQLKEEEQFEIVL